LKSALSILILLFISLSAWGREIELRGAFTLSIELRKADVKAEVWDQDKLDVEGKGLKYRILRENGRIVIRSPNGEIEGYPELRVRMPHGMGLELSLDNGRAIVSGVEGEIRIAVGEGDILLDGTSGSYDVAVSSGNIAAKLFLDGEARFKSVDGNIYISVLSDDPMPMEVESGRGDILIELLQGYHAALEMFSGNGKAKCDFNLIDRSTQDGRIDGKIGEGGPYLKASAYKGSVWIKKVILPHPGGKAYTNRYVCFLTKTPPQIDGYPNDRTWWDGDPIELDKVHALFKHDGEKLYGLIVIRCDPDQLKAKTVDRGVKFKGDSYVKLIFIENHRRYTLMVNPIETIYCENWNPIPEVASGIGSDFWLIELAIPLRSISQTPLEKLGFNLEVKAGDVKAKWAENGNGEMILSQDPPRTWMTKIEKITVEDSEPIGKSGLLKLINMNEGDQIPLDDLEIIRANLLLTGIFQDISFVVEKSDSGVNLTVKPLLSELYLVRKIEISGMELLDGIRMARIFRTIDEAIPEERAKLWAKMIERVYVGKGYDFAKVGIDVENDRMIVEVNEGIIKDVKVSGNRRVRYGEVKRAFGKLPFLVKNRTELERMIRDLGRRLREENSSFSSIKNWRLEEIKGGYLLRLQIAERKPFSSHLSPLFDFNRVHGVVLGGKYQISSRLCGGERLYAEVERGFSSSIWDYNLGAEKGIMPRGEITLGGHMYRMTETNDLWRISRLENLLAELIFGRAYMDFLRREGWEVYSSAELSDRFRFRIGYSDDRYESLTKTTDWYLFSKGEGGEPRRRIYNMREGWRLPDERKRENPAIDEGEMRSLWARFYVDLRDERRWEEYHLLEYPSPAWKTRNGWLAYLGVELAGGWLGGDFDFSLVRFMIARYNRLGRHRIDIRLMGSYTPDKGKLPLQRKTYLGGMGSLRGYHFKEFEDDSLLLLNLDYGLKLMKGLWLDMFLDAGYLWYRKETKMSSGFGFNLGPIRVDFAQALSDPDREMIMSLRIRRVF